MEEIKLQGTLGKTVTVVGNCIKIKPSRNSNNIKTILINNIVQVSVKKPSIIQGGFIHFQKIIDNNANEGILGLNDVNKVILDPNAIIFNSKEKYKIALDIKKYIEDYTSKSNENIFSNISTADELSKFKKLLDDGIINEEEFNKQKNKLLG
ncbi:MAG: SHOCT domain-containing protein [Clostridium sp.]|uniref:SHOCT domain-containing protein n=1 Tax=Clostridium sp. TaxID=1506 RepID=UPI0025BB6F14|nr:SHOCT domain-containing protein [Clostridium sp.]MCF0149699.1 SHOCT domain-containing protein [Clostridium sp.]